MSCWQDPSTALVHDVLDAQRNGRFLNGSIRRMRCGLEVHVDRGGNVEAPGSTGRIVIPWCHSDGVPTCLACAIGVHMVVAVEELT